MGTGAIKAGEAFVSIYSDDKPLVRGIRGLGERVGAIGKSFQSMGTKVAAVGAGVSALGASIVGPLAAATNSFVSFGDSLNKMAARTGFTAEALSELGFAAEQSGTDISAIESSVQRMQRAIVEANDGSKSMVDSFAAIGLQAAQLQGLSPDQQFQTIAAAIAKIPDPTQRAARAMEIFGRSGTKLLPLITSDIQGLRDEAKSLGITLSTDDANAAAELGDAMNRVGRTVKAAFVKLGAAIAPPLTRGLEIVTSVTSAVAKWIDENRGVTQTVAAIGAGLTAVGGVITVIGGGVAALGFAISGVSAALGLVGSVVSAVGIPAIAITAGVAAQVVAIGGAFAYVANEAGLLAPAFSFLKDSFGKIWTTFRATFGGIVGALKSGQFRLAAEIAWAGVKVASLKGAQQVLSGIEHLWNNAGSITSRFFEAYTKYLYRVFSNIPKVAFAALKGGKSINDVIQSAIFGAFAEGGELNLSASLDSSIGKAQAELRRKLSEVNRPAPARNPIPNRRPQAAPNFSRQRAPQFAPPPRFPQQQAPQFRQQRAPQPPSQLRGRFQVPPGVAPSRTAANANATARPPAAQANQIPGIGELIGLNRRQVFFLARLAEDGGLG